jgi:hypothetical protein
MFSFLDAGPSGDALGPALFRGKSIKRQENAFLDLQARDEVHFWQTFT